MKITTLLLISSAAVALASNPLIEIIDDKAPSQDKPDEIIKINGGPPEHVHWRTFGSDKIEQARQYGISVRNNPSLDELIWVKAFKLYPEDHFFRRCFYQYARNP